MRLRLHPKSLPTTIPLPKLSIVVALFGNDKEARRDGDEWAIAASISFFVVLMCHDNWPLTTVDPGFTKWLESLISQGFRTRLIASIACHNKWPLFVPHYLATIPEAPAT